MKLHFNDEQRKHLSVTLRTLSAGLFIPTMLSLLGFSQVELSYGKMASMAILAVLAEIGAYQLLKTFDRHESGGKDNGTD